VPHPAHERHFPAQQRTDAAELAMRRPDARGKTLQRAGSRRQDAMPDDGGAPESGAPPGN
jgi:hypothetical protein